MSRNLTRGVVIASVSTVVASLGLAATAVSGVASTDPAGLRPAAQAEPQAKPDNRPDAMSIKKTALRQRAVDALVAGEATTVGKGEDRTIQLADGTVVDYPATQTAQLLTFLVDFGDGQSNPAFPDNTEGPLANEIPEPASSDNTTYWLPDFDRQHFMDMFFNGLADQDGESFRNVYKEMSSGRFDLEGDVSDWVTVPNAASYYQTAVDADGDPATPPAGEEDGASMMAFLTDGATAWYDDQVAAGKTDDQINDYLSSFDVWDRFDYDNDEVFDEPDGYIDHFQAVHAGEDESAGAAPWAIWAHRSSVNSNGDVGPADNANGGIQIGNSDFWIRDYTVEPENGGLGVFAHEFAHDLGVPDYYDTTDGDNSVGYWTLMDSGSWLGHGEGTIGTTPNHMGAPDKLFLGWYGTNDLAIVDGTADPRELALGPSYHATTEGAQAVAVNLPEATATVDVVEPDQGTHYFYSGNGDDRVATVTGPPVTVPPGDPTLTARVSYSIEDDWDYAYLKVSEDGGATWDYVETNLSVTTDPNQQNEGFGITGCSGTRGTDTVCDNAWTDLSADLTAYAGDEVLVEFEMANDGAYHELGFSVDSIALGGTVLTDVEDGAPAWTLDGFRVVNGSSYSFDYDHYYLAENRQYTGYDETLAEGPYSFDYSDSAPDKVDHYAYQDGLLIWYVNGLYADNNTSGHPGGGQAIPVDSHPEYSVWTYEGDPDTLASGRLQAYDSTFDVDATAPLHLVSEDDGDVLNYDVAGGPGIPVFDDSDPLAYWDDLWSISGWFSTKVAGVGAMIQVLSSDETTGKMVIKAGKRFVAATSKAAITGDATVGQTLTAVAPAYFQGGVIPTYQWRVDGVDVAGATLGTYVVRGADKGKPISVVVTGAKADYLSSVEAAPAVTGGEAMGPVATKAVAVSGTATVGQTLAATPATWPVDGTSTFAWSVGGQAVGGGTTYRLKPADTGKAVTVTETRVADGYATGTSTSAATAAVAPATTSLVVDAPKKVTAGHKPKLTVSVSAPGLTPTGTIKVTIGGEQVAAKALANGKVVIKLAKQRKAGKLKIVVSYVPDTGYVAASDKVRITVKKR